MAAAQNRTPISKPPRRSGFSGGARALWQISVSLSGPAEDAVVALLERLFSLPVLVYTDEETKRSVVSVYLPRKPDEDRYDRAALAEGLRLVRACGLRTGRTQIGLKRVPRVNWAEAWKKHFPPIAIGSTLHVVPSWHSLRPREKGAAVVLDPGLSFGTGHHPTTLFCLRQLVAHRQAGQKQSLLDIGTGSGILAISAAKLGYSPVRAVDIDPQAIRIARANAVRNNVQTRLSISHRDLTRLPLQGGKSYDLVCANLIRDLLLTESQRILNRLKPGGILVLAGILAKEFLEVQRHYAKQGLRLLASAIEEEWQSGSFHMPATPGQRLGYFEATGKKNRKND